MGVPGIFALTGLLALAAIVVVRFVIPDPLQTRTGRQAAGPAQPVGRVLLDHQLLRLNYGIFALHAVLMALFVVVPFSLRAQLPAGSHWMVYLPVMCGAIVLMLPPMLAAERKGLQKPVFVGAVGTLIAALVLLALGSKRLGLDARLACVFRRVQSARGDAAFADFEARAGRHQGHGDRSLQQRAIHRHVHGRRGGRLAVAALRREGGVRFLRGAGGGLAAVGAGHARAGKPGHAPLSVAEMDSQAVTGLTRRLAGLPGVREVMLSGEGVAYLKVDSQGFDEQNVIKLLGGEI